MPLYQPQTDQDVVELIAKANNKNSVIVFCFSAVWCQACTKTAPSYEELANRFVNAFFIKIDVDRSPTIASKFKVKSLPTFVFLKKDKVLAEVNGANVPLLRSKAEEFCDKNPIQPDGEDSDHEILKDGFNLKSFIDLQNIECLNSKKTQNIEKIFYKGKTKIISDADEQLIFYVKFNQFVKMTNIIIRGPRDNGPKNVKLFVNLPSTPSFDACDSSEATQDIELTQEDLEKNVLSLKLVRFQKINSIAIFVENNQEDKDETQIDYIGLIGSTISTTNMTDFKRVTGKAGEAHS